MRVLNLYAGIGGNRKLWPDNVKVTAVEFNPGIAKIYQELFPDDTVIVGDAHQYLLDHYKEFDFIWSSPPCPTHSEMRLLNVYRGLNKLEYPDMRLYQEIIILEKFFDGKYCVENVIGYYEPLIPAKKSGRHYFWTNFRIKQIQSKNRLGIKEKAGVTSISSRAKEYGINVNILNHYKGDHKEKLLKNCVDPEIGLMILNCALGIIQKQTHQTQLF